MFSRQARPELRDANFFMKRTSSAGLALIVACALLLPAARAAGRQFDDDQNLLPLSGLRLRFGSE